MESVGAESGGERPVCLGKKGVHSYQIDPLGSGQAGQKSAAVGQKTVIRDLGHRPGDGDGDQGLEIDLGAGKQGAQVVDKGGVFLIKFLVVHPGCLIKAQHKIDLFPLCPLQHLTKSGALPVKGEETAGTDVPDVEADLGESQSGLE